MNEEEILTIGCKVVVIGENCDDKIGIFSRFLANALNSTNYVEPTPVYFHRTMNIEGNKFVNFEIMDYKWTRKI